MYRWKSGHTADPEQSFPGRGHMKPLEEYIRHLERELAQARQERDFFKKTLGLLFHITFMYLPRQGFKIMLICFSINPHRNTNIHIFYSALLLQILCYSFFSNTYYQNSLKTDSVNVLIINIPNYRCNLMHQLLRSSACWLLLLLYTDHLSGCR